MCGIAGYIDKRGEPVSAPFMKAMTDVIAHRGPDGEGAFCFQNVGLGHRRLAIIDLSAEGHQPMQGADGSCVITFNGEIYNYIELRQELQGLGHVFRSHSDTEVILAAYAQWGAGCVSRFNGMWAFAILDQRNRRLFCSRDRFGVKPFYYVDQPHFFAFGSEMRQLLPLLDRVACNKHVLTDFLLTSIADHTSETFFESVIKLPPGHNLVYELGPQRYEIDRYYYVQQRSAVASLSAEEAVATYMQLLEDSVSLRLRADVPVATCLSGGLDSSTVASIAAQPYFQASGRKFHAITAISEQESNNEAGFAKQVADAGGMSWLTVKPGYDDFQSALPKVVSAQEEPFGSTSLIMQYFVMKTARDHGIPVLLDGQGGDETLLGYEKYFGGYLARCLKEQGPKAFLDALRAGSANNAKLGLSNALKYLIGGLVAPARYFYYLRRHRYLASRPPYPSHLTAFAKASWSDFDLQSLEIASTNLPVLLRYEDKNSMAHSIETRLPFLDYRVLETALSLPGHYKIRDGWTKWVLRKGMEGRMPDSIVWRKNKLGFEAPEDIWTAKHLPQMRSAVKASPLLADIANPKSLAAAYDSLDKRSQWRLYSIALWENAFGVTQ